MSRLRESPLMTVADVPSISFRATLPVKPSVTTTSATPAVTWVPSTLPTKSIPAFPASFSWAAWTAGLPFIASSPLESRATRGRADTADRRGESRPHERVLDQVIGPRLGRRPHVEQGHGRPRARAGSPRAPAGGCPPPLDLEQSRGDERPGRAARDERVGLAGGDCARRAHDRGLGARADGAAWGPGPWRSRPARRPPPPRLPARRARRPGRTAARGCRARGRRARRRPRPRRDRGRRRWHRRRRSPAHPRARATPRGRETGRRPRAPRRCRSSGRPDAGAAARGTAGTR